VDHERIEDLGRDLICGEGADVQLFRAKYGPEQDDHFEKQFSSCDGTSFMYARGAGHRAKQRIGLVCTSQVSDTARRQPAALGIRMSKWPWRRLFDDPKCNVNGQGQDYHLPFDQPYDRGRSARCRENAYVKTAAEAERKESQPSQAVDSSAS